MAPRADVFVSYTQADRGWAEWIAWQLEAAGHTTVLQAWDFAEGENFLARMQQASAESACTVALLSPEYVQSRYATDELWAAFAAGRLLPVRVRDVDLEGILRVQVYRDLVGLPEADAREQVLAAVKRALDGKQRAKPDTEPAFPGGLPAPSARGGRAPRFPVASVVVGLPHRPALFTGRGPELETLERLFGTDGRAVASQAIVGLGGVGKTQLALHYAHAHLHEYDIVAWVLAEQDATGGLRALADALGLAQGDRSPAQHAQLALRQLETCEERWLLVLDNLPGPEDYETCAPSHGNGHVLVTSRHRGLDQYARVLAVDVFDDATGADYLITRAPRAGEHHAAAALSHALGGLPLALAHAGAYCARGIGFADYQGLLALPAPELFHERPEAFYRETVASTWTASIDAAGGQAPEARAALAITAYLAPTGTPVALVLDALGDTGDQRRRLRSLDALRALDTFSLIDLHGDELDTHRLLQKIIRDDAHERDDQAAGTSALDALTRAFPNDVARPGSWPVCAALLPQVTAYADTTPSDENAERAVALLNHAVDYLLNAGDAARAIVIATAALDLGEQRLGAEDPETLTSRANLANSYRKAGRTGEAIALQEAVLADSERLLGHDDPATLTTRANLANSYRQAGRTGEAITLLEAVLADRERLLLHEHPDTLTARSNLAFAYWQAGRTDEAITLEEAVLADRERLLGPEQPDT
ncbi:MAG TPA: FxSxx-COOH system tetratricopeptide repeat protein, partial [Solirubrobacter sp.]